MKADGVVVNTVNALNEIKEKKSPGDYITLTVIRDGGLVDIKVELLEEKPSSN